MTEKEIQVQATIKGINKELPPHGGKNFANYNKFFEKRIRKKCLGCLATFNCYKSQNYDYCSAGEINNSRYFNKDSPGSECDGSGPEIPEPNILPPHD